MWIGPYKVVGELGRGGMGVVFAARHPDDPRPLAIKLLRRVASARALTRFAREAAAMAKVSHPHVVRIVDVGETAEGPYIVLEQIEGQSFADRLEEGPLEPRHAAEVCAQIAAGVGALHRAGILHRDLKPGNVMLRTDGSAVVLDLGLAHEESAESLTRTGQLVGTPAYMSPEQAAGQHRDIDERSDVYALGATLFSAVSGRPPFTGDNLVSVACAVLKSRVVWPKEVPAALAAIGRKAMAKTPSDRYADALAFEQDLHSYLAGQTPQRTRSSPRSALAGLALLGVVAAAIAFTVGSSVGRGSPSPSARQGPIATRSPGASATRTPGASVTPAPAAGNPVKEAAELGSEPEGVRLEKTRAWLRRYPTHRLAARVRRSFLSLKLARGPHEVLGQMASDARFVLGPQGSVTGFRFLPNEEEPVTEFLQRRGPSGPLQVIGRLSGDAGAEVIHRPGTSWVALCGLGPRSLRLVDPQGGFRALEWTDEFLHLRTLASSPAYLAVSGFDSFDNGSALLAIYRWSDLIQSRKNPEPVARARLGALYYGELGFLPDGTLVGVGRPAKRLDRWRFGDEGLQALPQIAVHVGVATFAAHPKRQWLAVALETFQLQILDADTGEVLSLLQDAAAAKRKEGAVSFAQAHYSYPTSATFSPNGERLFTTSGGGGLSELRVWKTAGEPETHEEYATPVLRPATGPRFQQSRISPDGRWLLTISRQPPRPGEEPQRKSTGQPEHYTWDALVEVWDVGEEP